jgi:hypothetical protein
MPPALFDDSPDLPRLTGTHLVPCHGALIYWPVIRGGDVVKINLDVQAVTDAGLYLCEFAGAGGKPWRGVRRFKAPSTGQQAFDHSGRGNYMPLSAYEAERMRVIGRVEQVYKPANG